jgi:hypothetical protein
MSKLYSVQPRMTPYVKTPRSLCYDGRFYPNGECVIVKPAKKLRKRKSK